MIFMNSNQNVKKPADASKNTQQQDQDKDKTARKGAQGAMKSGDDREDAQGDDVIGTQHGHTNKAMGNAANPGQHQKDNAGHQDGGHDKNKSKDAGGHDKNQGATDKHQGSSDKHQGSGGGQHKH